MSPRTTPERPDSPEDPLVGFSDVARHWFHAAFEGPTAAQRGAWRALAGGSDVLVVAPTGSGKTLAAFLSALDRLATQPPPADPRRRCRVLYVSPLKALAVDVERNLRGPLAGMRQTALRMGLPEPEVSVQIRSGDTPAADRRRFVTHPPDILITTPESLFLLLTSAAREALTGVETVIVDEVHAVAGTKRGAHLALSLERLDRLLERPARRIGLSATVRPATEVARYLSPHRGAEVVQPPSQKEFDLSVVVPVRDLGELGGSPAAQAAGAVGDGGGGAGDSPERRASIWPHVEERIAGLIEEHRSTIVFANSRRLAERLCNRLNEIAAEQLAGAAPDGADLDAADAYGPDLDAADPDGAQLAAAASRRGAAEPERPRISWRTPAEMMAQAGAARGAPAVLARAHHGSVSREQRAEVEEALKAGRLPAVVATSSLELGIDMGAVDLVVQVESPPSVASGLQRVGRAGHQVGAVSRGMVFPKYRGDLLQAAVVTERMRAGLIEELRVPRNPLDVLAQQIVAMVAMDTWDVEELLAVVRGAAPFASLPASAFESVLDMLAGRYPSDAFAELRPRIVWDRVAGTVSGRPGAQRLAVTSGGTIPDRGLFGVFLAGEGAGRRVGELDEEMVYESRVGDVFTLGTTSWRIEDITRDKVVVSPAPGVPGKLPFWHGDALGRPLELGRAVGAFVREVGALDEPAARARLAEAGLDAWATDNLLSYLAEQREATGHLPDDRTIVVERFRDELGDWRVVVHSPFGAQVHAPWALALGARLSERFGYDAQVMHGDDGIVLRLPDSDLLAWDAPGWDPADWGAAVTAAGGPEGTARTAPAHADGSDADDFDVLTGFTGLDLPAPPAASVRPAAPPPLAPASPDPDTPPLGADDAVFPPEEIEPLVTEHVGGSALFAARFRECAARALLLPRRTPGRRTPLWQQRQRAAQLLQVAADFGSFPIVLETVRECLQDVFDVPGLVELMGDIRSRAVRVVEVTTPEPSPFARSLLFGYVAQFLYEGDSPLAERRAAALSLDSRLLSELLGQAELRELLDPQALAELEEELQRLTPDRAARDAEGVADLLRMLGPLDDDALRARGGRLEWAEELRRARRVIQVRIAGRAHWAAVEDAGRLRDALGTPLPVGVPEAFTEPVRDPLGDLLSRWARTHGPFTAQAAAAAFGLGPAVVTGALSRLAAAGRVVEGEFRPGGTGTEWCDAQVLRRLRRRSLATLRQELEPVAPTALAAFLPQWQHVSARAAGRLRGADGLLRAVEQLQGSAVPASALEKLVLPARVADYSPAMLDELTAAGEVLWAGAGALPGKDGWVALYTADAAPLLLPTEPLPLQLGPVHAAVLRALAPGYGLFFRQIAQAVAVEWATGAPSGPPGAPPVPGPDGATGPGGPAAAPSEAELVEALWDLAWAGYLTNDTLTPLRALMGSGRTTGATAHRARRATPRGRYGGLGRAAGRGLGASGAAGAGPAGSRGGPPAVAGRWSLLPPREAEHTLRAHALAETLLDRHGVVTRGAVVAEQVPGGFAAAYRVLSAFEETGRARRGYVVEGLGGAQFATEGAVDRLRAVQTAAERVAGGPDAEAGGADGFPGPAGFPGGPGHSAARGGGALVLAAADPANAYGGALPWPEAPEGTTHRPGRKAGALVVQVAGELVLYVERGGKSLLVWPHPEQRLEAAARALADAARQGALGRVLVERINGEPALTAPLGRLLEDAGFTATPRGLRMR
ncbi:Lhr family helicase [Allostreptomyces psammosilenae]|uniref:ATP-dependent Lhr-like helicase n=1 Tax=Allostreptomyces psammosilenae TaxID=1892865 RepID=A0A852ZY95_9ACTN|nr:DEAD/DEAH box helicase [Allostreptomyces psammosilenae]NYI03068.1 ATP-dependent Lhr-like helicase [Allostreptomyces psammosilenae]